MRVKCKSDFVTVFPPGGGHYNRSIDEVTKGNVYEVLEVVRRDYYVILPDEGFETIELPDYMFKPTEEPVTANPDRDKNEKKRQARLEEERQDRLKERRAQELRDSELAYYDPAAWARKQAARKNWSNALSKVFVGGLPYD